MIVDLYCSLPCCRDTVIWIGASSRLLQLQASDLLPIYIIGTSGAYHPEVKKHAVINPHPRKRTNPARVWGRTTTTHIRIVLILICLEYN